MNSAAQRSIALLSNTIKLQGQRLDKMKAALEEIERLHREHEWGEDDPLALRDALWEQIRKAKQ